MKKIWLCFVLIGLATHAQGYLEYTNEELGFRISYPATWEVEEDEGYITLMAPDDDVWDVYNENVLIVIEELSQPMDLDEYLERVLNEIAWEVDEFTVITDVFDINVSGHPAKLVTYMGIYYGYHIVTSLAAVIADSTAYVLLFSAEPDKVDLYSDTFDTILRSFEIVAPAGVEVPPVKPPIAPPGGEEKSAPKPPVKPPVKPPLESEPPVEEPEAKAEAETEPQEAIGLVAQPPGERVTLRYRKSVTEDGEVVEEATIFVIVEPLPGGKLRVTVFTGEDVEEAVVDAAWVEYVDGKPAWEKYPLFWNPGKAEIGGLSFEVTREDGVLKLSHTSTEEEIVYLFDETGVLVSYKECSEGKCGELSLVKGD